MKSLSWERKHWVLAGVAVLAALSGCSGDDDGGDGGGSGSAGSAGVAGSGGAAGSGGTVGSAGSMSGSSAMAGKPSGGSGGSGGERPNCGDLTCTSGQVCISSEALFVGEDSDECAAPPAGCSASAICDCNIPNWEGSPIHGCTAFVPPTLYVYDLSCGDAPCAAGTVCLIDESETKPPACVAAPEGCAIDNMFCAADCAKQVAMAAGQEYAGCKASSAGVGVTVRPL
jgi:hypothetical protein